MKTFACAAILMASALPAVACQSALLSAIPDAKEIAVCVKAHESRIAMQQETLDRWIGLHEKLAGLVFRQQDEIGKLKDEIFQLRLKLATPSKR